MELGTFDYSQLPIDLRLHFLCLPARRRRGRPKDLTFLERVRVAQAHAEALNAHAIHVRDHGRDRALAKLQAKFRGLCAAQAAPHKIAEVTAAIDKVGRVTRVPIRPPDKPLPEIDKQVAKLFGITERMVRRCRTDPKLQRFMPHPVWLERDWVKSARLDFEARQVAKRLMTPERLAKQGPLTLVNGAVRVGPVVGEIIQRPGPRHRVGCEDFGIGRQPRGELAPVPGIRSRRLGDFAQTVLSYSDVDHRRAERALRAWNETRREPPLPVLEAEFIPAEPWRHVWKRNPDPGWGAGNRPPIVARRMVLEGFVAQFLGSITQCALFAHTLRSTIVLGPHQTWPWMAYGTRKGIKPGSEPLERWRTLCLSEALSHGDDSLPLLGRVLINRPSVSAFGQTGY
jgi:hypothetical protein